MKKGCLVAWILIGLTFVSACGGGGGSGDPGIGGGACSALGARTIADGKIFNGETCDQNANSPVVLLVFEYRDGVLGNCTGTLVTIDDVLTSAHCFYSPVSGAPAIDGAAGVAGQDGEVIKIARAGIHPLFLLDNRPGSHFDIGMATLERVPNPPIGPVPILVSQPSVVGQRASTFGYGKSNAQDAGELKSAEITIEEVALGNIFATFQTSGASICPGDSGGPVIQNVNGITSLIGVNSFGEGGCVDTGAKVFGFVDLQFSDSISFIFDYAPDVPIN